MRGGVRWLVGGRSHAPFRRLVVSDRDRTLVGGRARLRDLEIQLPWHSRIALLVHLRIAPRNDTPELPDLADSGSLPAIGLTCALVGEFEDLPRLLGMLRERLERANDDRVVIGVAAGAEDGGRKVLRFRLRHAPMLTASRARCRPRSAAVFTLCELA